MPVPPPKRSEPESSGDSDPRSEGPYRPGWRRFLTVEWLVRLGLLAATVFLVDFVLDAKKPWETHWDARIAAGKVPGFHDYLTAGLWWASLVNAVLVAGLFLTSFWWTRAPAPPVYTVRPVVMRPQLSGPVFYALLLVVLGLAGVLRWQRMDFPIWGDEASPVLNYVHGRYYPLEENDLQGPMEFKKTTWSQVLFDDRRGGNNHYLLSITQRLALDVWRSLNGAGEHEFAEIPLRLAAFLAGIGLIAALALLLRRYGLSAAGIIAALLVTLHPWMIRAGSEARGYTLFIFFLFLAIAAIVRAMESGRWRWWFAFAAVEFLALYAWKGAPYLFVLMNGVAALTYLFARPENGRPAPWKSRFAGITRLVVANFFAVIVFVQLYLPCHPQITHFMARNNVQFGQTMDASWFTMVASTVVFGTSFDRLYPFLPFEMSVMEVAGDHPWLVWLSLSAIIATFATGMAWWARHAGKIALLLGCVFVTPLLAFIHFTYLMDAGMIVQYFLYLTPVGALVTATGCEVFGRLVARRAARTPTVRNAIALAPGAALTGLLLIFMTPVIRYTITQPVDRIFEAFALTRGRHGESRYPAPGERSDVFTLWIGRRAWMYEPREIRHVHTADEVEKFITKAEAVNGSLYVITGNLLALRSESASVVKLLEKSGRFEKLADLFYIHPIMSLQVYRYTGPAN